MRVRIQAHTRVEPSKVAITNLQSSNEWWCHAVCVWNAYSLCKTSKATPGCVPFFSGFFVSLFYFGFGLCCCVSELLWICLFVSFYLLSCRGNEFEGMIWSRQREQTCKIWLVKELKQVFERFGWVYFGLLVVFPISGTCELRSSSYRSYIYLCATTQCASRTFELEL